MPWTLRAACRNEPKATFFPSPGRGSGKAAKAICASCEVDVSCLAYALRTGQPDGIWGGMTADERSEYDRWARVNVRRYG
jgi:WhiB family redox-sensing transcriptional regulator